MASEAENNTAKICTRVHWRPVLILPMLLHTHPDEAHQILCGAHSWSPPLPPGGVGVPPSKLYPLVLPLARVGG